MARADDTDREWEQRSAPACESCAELRARLESAEKIEQAAKELLNLMDWVDGGNDALESAYTNQKERLRAALGAAGERSEE